MHKTKLTLLLLTLFMLFGCSSAASPEDSQNQATANILSDSSSQNSQKPAEATKASSSSDPQQNTSGKDSSLPEDTSWASLSPPHSSAQKDSLVFEKNDLSSWVGYYQCQEKAPPYLKSGYTVSIYKQGSNWLATVHINDWGTGLLARAYVTGNDDAIEIHFMEDLVHFWQGYHEGEVLWRFIREKNEIRTEWVSLDFVYEKSDFTFVKQQSIPECMDEADNELLQELASPDGGYVAYKYSSRNRDTNQTLYLVSILKVGQQFVFQPANIYASRHQFEIAWDNRDENDWGDAGLTIYIDDTPREDILFSWEYIEEVFIGESPRKLDDAAE